MREIGNVCGRVPFEGKEHAFFNYSNDENRPFMATLCATDQLLGSPGSDGWADAATASAILD